MLNLMDLAPAPPGYCDPAFEDSRDDLMDWLHRRGRHRESANVKRVPVYIGLSARYVDETSTAGLAFTIDTVTLQRETAAAPAPYVGRPFVYEWPLGVDEQGRQVAGEARICYVDANTWYREGGADLDQCADGAIDWYRPETCRRTW